MTQIEIIKACWRMYPLQCIGLSVFVPTLGATLAVTLFCLIWNKLNEQSDDEYMDA